MDDTQINNLLIKFIYISFHLKKPVIFFRWHLHCSINGEF